jgi:uncharacterized membrane protein
MAAAGSSPRPSASPTDLDELWRDPKNWNGGIYFNKEDPRFLVPKTPYRAWSWGWTMNLGHDNAEFAIVGGILAIGITLAAAKHGAFSRLGRGFHGWRK